MNSCRKILLVLLVLMLGVPGCACPEQPRDDDYMLGARAFDAAAAQAYIEYLASDELDGRLVGSDGGRLAADYIATRFAEYGLQHPASFGDYQQDFDSPVTLTNIQPVLALAEPPTSAGRPAAEFAVQQHFIPRSGRFLGSGNVTAEVVWLGGCLPADIAGAGAGRIVLCAPLTPDSRAQAVQTALHYGIAGLLEITENEGPYLRSAYGWCDLIDMPAFTLGQEAIETLLESSPYGLADLYSLAQPVTLDISVTMTAFFSREQAAAHNVLGVLPGTDLLLSDEVVIIGAHYDGPGSDPDGTIYNAANDNASGVAVLLEIARMWQAQGVRPSRTVVFAAWDGEEQIVRGSSYYVSDPIFPLEKTAAYFNLDAVGVGEVVSIYGDNPMTDRLKAYAVLQGINYHPEPGQLSDDIPFNGQGIPTAGIMVLMDTLEYYPQLHMPGDDPGIIGEDTLRMVGIMSAYALFSWADGR